MCHISKPLLQFLTAVVHCLNYSSSISGRSQKCSGAKPLLNKKFYLDLKNHIASSNLEQKLKSLGAVSIHVLFVLMLLSSRLRNVS